MPMTNDERRVYNVQYYQNNKKRISDILLKKVECPFCSREIAYSSLQRHQTTPLCLRRRGATEADKVNMEKLQAQIEKLTQEVNALKA